MKVRQRVFTVNWHPMRKIHIAKSMLMRHKELLHAATVNGMVFKGWFRGSRVKYQVAHLDYSNAGSAFYRAIGIPLPNKFITHRVTVGGLDRLLGYLKLHVTQEERDEAAERLEQMKKQEREEDEEDEDG